MTLSAADKSRIPQAAQDRYSTVAIALHWTIAALLALQVFLGFHLQDLDGQPRVILLLLHKSFGIVVLLLTLVRLGWRITNKPPEPDSSLTKIERVASHWVHLGFYALLLALPLTGWAMSSMEQSGGLQLFGVIPWPGVPLLNFLPGLVQDFLADLLGDIHQDLVWVALVLIALHVGGALKHHFISRDPTVARMVPGAKPGRIADPRLIGVVVLLAVLAGAVYLPELPEAKVRPKPTNLAKADIYLDIVGPELNRRCASCHSDGESRGGFSVSSFEAVMRGGRSGSSVTPGDVTKSDLYRRILPSAGKDFMPKGDRPPLTPEQAEAIKVWISAGAPASRLVGDMHLSGDQLAALQTAMGTDGEDSGGPARAQEVLPVVAKADPALVTEIQTLGFVVRPLNKQSNLLDINYTGIGVATPQALADLAKLAPQARTLSLLNAGVGDGEVKTIAAFPNLVRLRLEGDPVTDASAPLFASMKNLRQLSLVKTKVTDAGLATLAAAPALVIGVCQT